MTALLCAVTALGACKRNESASSEAPPAEPAPAEAQPAAAPAPVLLVAQAQFERTEQGPVPGPAKLVLVRPAGDGWDTEVIEDPASNVFHKAIVWREGLLTIGGTAAKLVHWTRGDDGWTGETLFERSWGGKFDRLRDLELGDVDGKPGDEIVLATHDRGVVAIGSEQNGEWTFTELGEQDDTFVHEIELGDLDGDGTDEIYFTPSPRNRSDGTSQAGEVARYRFTGDGYERDRVARWDSSHAKEILVTDLDGGGEQELYVVREAHIDKQGDALRIVDPVTILRYRIDDDGAFVEQTVAALQDRQARFLLAADVTGDGKRELVAAGMNSGLWMLTPEPVLIDADSGGFEHAIHTADLDRDGALELYVASDRQGELRRYRWNGERFDREVVMAIPAGHITWNLQDGSL